jgi:aminoglycoside phosphotransferase (APT) family kinase protein
MNLQHLFHEKITKQTEISTGFSTDKKFIINDNYLVRVMPLDKFNHFQTVFEVQKKFYTIALCQKPIKLVKSKDNVYYITNYIKGKDGLEVITTYTKMRQYELGFIAAVELSKFHNSNPLPSFNVKKYYQTYLQEKVELASNQKVRTLLPEIDEIIQIVYSNIHHLYQLNGVQTHADYHLFNMIFDNGEYKGVIDFERVRPGIFLTDFRNNTPHNSSVSPEFASGFIDGYLDRNPIDDFFLLYNIHDLLMSITAIPWVLEHDYKNLNKTIQIIQNIYSLKSNLRNTPHWYIGKGKTND